MSLLISLILKLLKKMISDAILKAFLASLIKTFRLFFNATTMPYVFMIVIMIILGKSCLGA